MMDDQTTLDLPIAAPARAREWTFLRCRVDYLEATLVQLLRDRDRLKEWYTAAELVALALPGLPRTARGIHNRAGADAWRRRIVTRSGGETVEYHAASLPMRAFDRLLDRIVCAPPPSPIEDAPTMPPPVARPAAGARPVTPPWLLPLMRTIRDAPGLPLPAAVEMVACHHGPVTLDEARNALRAVCYVHG